MADPYGHILRVETREARRVQIGSKWCWGCRKRLPHERVVYTPVDEMSCYGPHDQIECSGCHQDRTLFLGRKYIPCDDPHDPQPWDGKHEGDTTAALWADTKEPHDDLPS